MGIKSRLFASAAFPLLSLSLIFPANGFAAAVAGSAPQHKVSGASAADPMSFEVAQDAPQPEDPLLIPPGKKPEEQKQEPEAAPPAAEPQAAPEPEPKAAPQPEAPPAEPAPAPQPEPKAEQPAPAAPQAEAPAPAPKAEQPPPPPAASEQPAPEPQAQPAEQPNAAPAQEAPAPQAEPQQPAATQEQPLEKKRDKKGAAQGEKRPGKGDKKPAAEEPPPAPATDAAPVPPAAPAPADAPAVVPPAPADQPAAAPAPQDGEAAAPAPAAPPAPADGSAPAQPVAPAAPDAGQAANAPISEPAPIPPPEKVTPQELERRKEIAADPAKSNETVILPVQNGAAVLDSDKEAQRSGTPQTREERQKLRAQERDVKVPKSDADAQIVPQGQPQPAPVKIEAVTSEQGKRMSDRPEFARPEGTRVGEEKDNRVILQINNNVVVRSDDDRRFLRDGEQPEYEQLSRDRYRETIARPDGYRIVTVRNRYGDIIQRSRIDNRGREYVLYYSPELYDDPDQDYSRDPAEDLPPMRLRVPLRDYIIDTTTDPNRDYYDFLAQPPVEPVERVYSLNEVKYSARIRDKVPRIDLDTVTFATGSAEIPMTQAKTLRKVADAINEVLKKDQSETFLIEGHTDAVGSDQSNLILSDMRAESVANVLTDVYGIPPENLATQGYGERYLKVNTAGPEQANRRVTIRRVTALVRPVAANQ